MNLHKLNGFETVCCEKTVGGGYTSVSDRAVDTIRSLQREFNQAVDVEFVRYCRDHGSPTTENLAEAVYANARLSVVQQWLNEKREMCGLEIGAFKPKFG